MRGHALWNVQGEPRETARAFHPNFTAAIAAAGVTRQDFFVKRLWVFRIPYTLVDIVTREGDDVINISRTLTGRDSLQWRINPGFDNYVRNQTGDGTVTVSDGAFRDEGGYYHFPRTDTPADPDSLHFGGSVEFRAYLGVLSLRIAGPSFQVSRNLLRMFIVDDAAPAGTLLELATAAIEPGQVGSVMLDLRLTERGSDLFFGKYPAGTPLAPVNVLLPVQAADMALTEGVH